MTLSDITSTTKLALLFGVVGFLASFTSFSSSSVNGVTTCSFIDYGAILFGVLAIGAGSVGELSALRLSEAKLPNLLLSSAAVVLGALHIARGLGYVGGPC